ncbi:MAG: restriction endonuclease [Candidatus Roizmanbacteria bacterium]
MILTEMPKFYDAFIPTLQILADSGPLHYNDLRIKVRNTYFSHLPQELLDQKTKSGDILILNRIGWAKAYLKQAGMIEQPRRAIVQITDRGRAVLSKGTLTLQDLKKDEVFLANRKSDQETSEVMIDESSPQDLIDSGIRSIESEVKKDLLSKLQAMDPYYFQKVILLLLEKMGYGDFIETSKSGDGGIDGVISEDKLGLDKIYIQAKRYSSDNKVREPEIRNFIGAMGRATNKGIFVTTSSFDAKAIQKARDAGQKIIMIDGNMLVDLMYRYGVGVQVKNSYEVKELDEDFFEA